MTKLKELISRVSKKEWVLGATTLLFLVLSSVFGITALTAEKETVVNVDGSTTTSVVLSTTEQTALVEAEDGTQVETNLPNVEAIDAPVATGLCESEDLDLCGQGWWVDTSTPQAFINATNGQCLDLDSSFGSQCVDSALLFWENYTNDGRWFSTCGTGSAKGALNCWEYNAGSEFEMIWNASDIQTGDWVITTGGTYGHVFMASGNYNNGWVASYGTNQGGGWCPGGGSASNTVNLNLSTFGGAFRPKTYHENNDKPTPIPISNCVEWYVERGDTMSAIMLNCEGTVVYGEAMNAYADTWWSQIKNPGKTVYDGWNDPNTNYYGLFEDDRILHKID